MLWVRILFGGEVREDPDWFSRDRDEMLISDQRRTREQSNSHTIDMQNLKQSVEEELIVQGPSMMSDTFIVSMA